MSDFTYDSYDISTLKTALEHLRKVEQQGFWLGVVGGFPLGAWIVGRKSVQHKFVAGPWSKLASGIVVGSLM